MSIFPQDHEFKVVAAILAGLALVAIFAVSEPIAQGAIALAVVLGGYLLFQRGK